MHKGRWKSCAGLSQKRECPWEWGTAALEGLPEPGWKALPVGMGRQQNGREKGETGTERREKEKGEGKGKREKGKEKGEGKGEREKGKTKGKIK